jgi:hypothetical protein
VGPGGIATEGLGKAGKWAAGKQRWAPLLFAFSKKKAEYQKSWANERAKAHPTVTLLSGDKNSENCEINQYNLGIYYLKDALSIHTHTKKRFKNDSWLPLWHKGLGVAIHSFPKAV